MTRDCFESYVKELYGVLADHPFEDDLVTAVFRHANNKKWFALLMNIPASRLGIGAEDNIDVANLKCPPEIAESLLGEAEGVYPAYHMNKMHWISVSIGECEDETLLWLLEISHSLTAKKTSKRSK